MYRFGSRAARYPVSYRLAQLDDYFGLSVRDSYRWLEDPDHENTSMWIDAQVDATDAVMKSNPEMRTQIANRLTEVYNYAKYSCPFKRGSRYFHYKNNGLQNQSVLYKQDSLESEPQVLIDPNTLEADGTASLSAISFSNCGEHVAYAVSRSGSDWSTISLMKVASREDYPETLRWAKFTSIAWTHDSRGLFYCRYPEPKTNDLGAETQKNEHHKVYYHRIGTPQTEDRLIYETPSEPNWMFGVEVSDDGRYLLITVSESTDPVNRLFYIDLEAASLDSGKFEVVKVIDNFEAEYSYITNDQNIFYFKTNLNAPRYRVISIDIASPAQSNWKQIIAESERDVLESASPVNNNNLVLMYLRDVAQVLQIHDLQTGRKLSDVPLPSFGSVGVACKRSQSEMFFKFESYLYPGTIFRYIFDNADLEHRSKDRTEIFREITIPGINPAELECKQVFYPSKDGTKIPMCIVARKDIVLDGSNPTLLYGYGGFSVSLSPYFSSTRVAFVKHYRGVLCVANLRGGGEYGEEWHKAGTLTQKQNVFDDFQHAAMYLQKQGYCTPSKLAIQGGSNGGLLVAACVNQAPWLFGAAVAQCGVLDMMRFDQFTIGYAWKSDYGGARDSEEMARYLHGYSPLHTAEKIPARIEEHLKSNPGEKPHFPWTLLTTADHDDRVCPLHSYKYIAELQHTLGKMAESDKFKDGSIGPALIRIERKAGHGAGKPTKKIIEEISDMYTFIGIALGVTWQA